MGYGVKEVDFLFVETRPKPSILIILHVTTKTSWSCGKKFLGRIYLFSGETFFVEVQVISGSRNIPKDIYKLFSSVYRSLYSLNVI